MKYTTSIPAFAAVASAVTAPNSLNVASQGSIKDVAATLAFDTMSYYKGNLSAPGSINVGDLSDPYYWWTAGALWGAMLDYYHYTNDSSYNDVVIQALLAPTNLAAAHDYMPPEHAFEEGNDDLFFWGAAALSAAERNFPQPNASLPSWLDIGVNVFNQLAGRWNTQNCGGGLLWQIYASNPNGLHYKNSVSNGGFFQIAARLARDTGNSTYLDWAEKIWDWSMDVGFIEADSWHIIDGADISSNCSKLNPEAFTYTTGIYLYGAAVMANHTGQAVWVQRAENILNGASWFFTGSKNNIMYEGACETVNKCNADMSSFKGYLSRFMWQSTIMVPSLKAKVQSLLVPTAQAAAGTCTGGSTKRECGQKWYSGGFDNNPGLGQEMCALETVQGLLAPFAPAPLAAKDIKNVRETTWKSALASTSATPSATGRRFRGRRHN